MMSERGRYEIYQNLKSLRVVQISFKKQIEYSEKIISLFLQEFFLN